jgi:hypothetical protein
LKPPGCGAKPWPRRKTAEVLLPLPDRADWALGLTYPPFVL